VDLPGVQVEATAAEREAAGVVEVAALQRAQSGEQLVDVEGRVHRAARGAAATVDGATASPKHRRGDRER